MSEVDFNSAITKKASIIVLWFIIFSYLIFFVAS